MAVLEERAYRLEKLQELENRGILTYPAKSYRTHTCKEALEHFDAWSAEGNVITLVGRLKLFRRHGGSAFVNIEDGTELIQLFFSKDHVGEKVFEVLTDCVDPADFIEVTGTLFYTKKGERTVQVQSYRLLSKALLPLPEKWHGLTDVEVRYRQRYLDLIANPAVRQIFLMRGAIVRTIRNFFEEQRFLEVETPMLQAIPGGALARPFITHHNALDADLYLRVAPELYLKRLIVGGYERVFEVARCFRNEGIDHSHNPEFTQVEAYMAYADYEDLMHLIENLFLQLSRVLFKDNQFEFEGQVIEMEKSFVRITFKDAIKQGCGLDIDSCPSAESLATEAKSLGVEVDASMRRGKILDELFKVFVVSKTLQPTFITDYPVELSPLAKRKAENPQYVERFQLVIARSELVNAFSELNDPQDQLLRFEEQQGNREQGDDEAHRVDMDYVIALEHGMPPTAGLGIGIDRLTALLTNSHSLKEVILFPTLRPKH